MVLTVHGRIVNKRPLSRKLVFLELERRGDHGLELLLKASTDTHGLTPVEVHTLRDALKLGDIVEAKGCFEADSHTFRVSSISVLESWKINHAGTSFVPKLLPSLHKHKQNLQADEGSIPDNAPHTSQQPATVNPQHPSLATQALCKYYVNTGRCLRGDACLYQHVKPNELPELRQGWVVARRRHKQALSSEAGNPHALDAARKGQRAAVFCDWLIATFGSEVLKQGSGVLDIAGGRGNVSFELQTVRGMRCTLIDPRPQKLSKAQRKWLKEFAETKQQPTAALQRGNSCKLSTTDEAQQSATGVHYSPLSQQAKTESQQTNAASQKTTAEPHAIAEQRTVAAPQGTTVASQGAALTSATVGVAALKLSTGRTANAGTDNAHLPSCGHQADSTDWVDGCTLDSQLPITQSGVRQMQIPEAQPTTQLGEADLRGTLSQQIQAEFNHELWTEGSMAKQLQGCSLVLGLHPDQATDTIVNFAMQFGKPFAVVPCCVFPRQFPDRRLRDKNGKTQPVLTHSELVQHLLQKSGGSEQYLPFEGMNQVVFQEALN